MIWIMVIRSFHYVCSSDPLKIEIASEKKQQARLDPNIVHVMPHDFCYVVCNVDNV